MNKLKTVLLLAFLFCVGTSSYAQQFSPNEVKYMITYEESEGLFTAWVVPSYSTPNFNNSDSEEKGATAQLAIKVPTGFIIGSFKSIKGGWDGYTTKIGSEAAFKKVGLTTGMEYYIIGKKPSETNYGVFKDGEPVALFSFIGKSENPNLIAIVDKDDEFVKAAYNELSLNVAPSFYSRSGQKANSTSKPLEQFVKKVSLATVIKEAATKLGATENLLPEEASSDGLLVYPNPSVSMVNIRYFSLHAGVHAQVELIDQNGVVLQEKSKSTHTGFNTTTLDISSYPGSMYFAKVIIGNKVISNKIIKTN
jgi:hypothetical protein